MQDSPSQFPTATDASRPLTIVRLTAENVKRLRAVSITPSGDLVVLSGRNGQGKSSILDAITYALGGAHTVCSEPVRRGEESAEVVCDLGDLIVTRKFAAGGRSVLEVTNREGLRYPSPQKILDELTGRLAFDPLAFTKMEPRKQSETLRAITGLDFSEAEGRRKMAFDERTASNREAKAAKARLDGIPKVEGLPAQTIAASVLAGQLATAQRSNSESAAVRLRSTQLQAEVERLRLELGHAEDAVCECLERVATLPGDVDVDALVAQMSEIDATNVKVRRQEQRAEIEADYNERTEHSHELTQQIESIDLCQQQAIAEAKMPVAELGLRDGGVTLNGLPLEQASAAEQLRVSVAIALAMNPRLRVLLIRDASLLDRDSLALVAEMAREANAQVWIERVESDDATAVIIEDGMVVEGGA